MSSRSSTKRQSNEERTKSPSCPDGFPEYMYNNHTVRINHTTVIDVDSPGPVIDKYGRVVVNNRETPEIANKMRHQKVVGLGIQCNTGWKGIQVISVATIEYGVYIYILRKQAIQPGLRSLLENPDCKKVTCNIYPCLLQRLRDNLYVSAKGMYSIDDVNVKSAGATIGVSVFVPVDPRYRYFTVPELDLGHMGYLAMNCLVPLMVVAHREMCGLKRHDCERTRRSLILYDVNKRSRQAYYEKVLAQQKGGPNTNPFETTIGSDSESSDSSRSSRENSSTSSSPSDTLKRRRRV